MILVTVGTTMPFDALLAQVDDLAGQDLFEGEALEIQSGQSAYRMRHGNQFRSRPSLAETIAGASLVITHGGATVIQLLLARKPFVAFPNPLGAGDHQRGFLTGLAEVAEISWSTDVADLARLFTERRGAGAAALKARLPRAADIIRGEKDRARGLPRNAPA